MSDFADLLETRLEVVVQRWAARLREGVASGGESESELRDHVPQLLRHLVLALRQEGPRVAHSIAQEHGRQRYRIGFDLGALVREHSLLRNSIFDLVKESSTAVSFDEVRILTDFLSNAVADAVTEHASQHNRAALAEADDAHDGTRQREAHLLTMLASIGDGVVATDVAARVTFLNPVAEQLTGWAHHEVVGKPLANVFRIINEHTRAPVDSPVDRVLREGIVTGLANHTLLVRKDGSEIPIDDSAGPIRTPEGALVGVILVFRDVTEKKHAEVEREALLAHAQTARAEAQAERDKQHALFMQAPVAIAILEGPEHRFTFANPAYRALVKGRDVVSKPLFEALPDVRDQGFDKLLDQVMATGETFYGNEVRIKLEHHVGDEVLVLNFVYSPKRDGAGVIDGVLVSASDVTDQVLARERVARLADALRASEERLLRVVEASSAGLWDLDAPTGNIVADARLMALMGLASETALTLDTALSAVFVDDRAHVGAAVARALAGENGGQYLTEFRVVGKGDVPLHWVESRAQVLFDAQGKAAHLAGAMLDITPRREADAARESVLRALQVQPSLFVAVLRGPDLVFDMANEMYCQLFAGGRDITGLSLREAFAEIQDGSLARLSHVLETGEALLTHELRYPILRASDGVLEERYFNVVHQPIRGKSGAFDSILALGHEVTDVVLTRQDAEARVRAEKERTAFEQQLIGIVSHDLRNPLNVVQVASALLMRRDDIDESATKLVVRIQNAGERATGMVRDLLDFTQARLGGGIPISPRPTDLHALVRTVADEVEIAYAGRALELVQEGDGQGVWDSDRLAQVVQNLTTNALKYSRPGSAVQVITRTEADWVTIVVCNEGVPIPAEMLPAIFEPFQRAVGQMSNSSRSVGLGLYIVKQIVDAHHGSVEVRSSEADGTCFTVRLPRAYSSV